MSAPAYRFLHAADLHLDSPFRGLSRHDPDLASRLRDASLVALTRMVDLAIDRECHFVVLAGDIYDGLERGVRAQLALKRAAVVLHDAGIPLVLLHGNHDPLDLGYTAVREWPASTHLLSATEPEVLVLDTPAGPVTITGQSFPDKRVERSLAAQYPPPSGPGLHVAVLHTELVWGEGTNPYSPCRLDDLVRTGFHYWALGHVHDPRVLHHRDPVVVYPGNLQGRHFLECGPRGAMLVEGAPQALRAEHQALAPLVFERVVVDVTELTDLTALQKALVDAIPAHDATRLLRAELEGRSSLFEALHDAERRQELLVALNDATADDAIWMEIRSSVRPDLPWDALAEQASLPGELVRRELDEAEAREVLQELPMLRAFARDLDDADLQDVMRRALHRAVDALHSGEG